MDAKPKGPRSLAGFCFIWSTQKPMERKFIDLKSLKVSDEGPGTIEGYRSVFSVIDEGGDLITPGAFKDTIAEYLESGFTAHSHDWDFDKAVGYPVEAHEDEHGWFVRSQFHSTPDAQAVRTKAKERMDAGKKVGFSFGYAPTEYTHIEAKDYETELAKYVKAENLQETLAKAQKFNRIRILKKVDAIEDSLVTAPMNKRAAATAVKSEENGALPFGTVEINGKTIPTGGYGCHTCPAQFKKIEEATEHGKVCRALNNEKNHKSEKDESEHLKEMPGTESFESFESAGTALQKFAQKMRSNHEIRTKEGRVLSSSNRAKVQACIDSQTALIADLQELMTLSEPKPKEKEIDVEALRTQSLRLRSLVTRTLAHVQG